MSRQPLPQGEEQQQFRAEAMEQRARVWSEVDPLGQAAWSAWRRVSGQVSILNPNAVKADDVMTILDTNAVLWSMNVEGIPLAAQGVAWDYIMAAHDVLYHAAENLTRLCVAHLMDFDGPLAVEGCRRCARAVGGD